MQSHSDVLLCFSIRITPTSFCKKAEVCWLHKKKSSIGLFRYYNVYRGHSSPWVRCFCLVCSLGIILPYLIRFSDLLLHTAVSLFLLMLPVGETAAWLCGTVHAMFPMAQLVRITLESSKSFHWLVWFRYSRGSVPSEAWDGPPSADNMFPQHRLW